MIAALAVLAALAGATAPRSITVSTAHGDQRVPVRADRGGIPLVSAPLLVSALGGTFTVGETWAEVTLADQGFRFLLGTPLFLFNNQVAMPDVCRKIRHRAFDSPLGNCQGSRLLPSAPSIPTRSALGLVNVSP